MFQGFNEATIKYFEAIRKENSKSTYKACESLYMEGVKEPLEELYYELFNYFGGVDSQLLSSKRRCISSAYNDARFCKEEPVKEYLYLRFKLDKGDKKSAPGFFLDASLEGYRYGLSIYKPETKDMEKIREYLRITSIRRKRPFKNIKRAAYWNCRGMFTNGTITPMQTR